MASIIFHNSPVCQSDIYYYYYFAPRIISVTLQCCHVILMVMQNLHFRAIRIKIINNEAYSAVSNKKNLSRYFDKIVLITYCMALMLRKNMLLWTKDFCMCYYYNDANHNKPYHHIQKKIRNKPRKMSTLYDNCQKGERIQAKKNNE